MDHRPNMSDHGLQKPDREVLSWLYLFLALLGFLTNGLVLYELWRTQRKPTVIFALNMVVSDIILCVSFLFRIAYYQKSDWHANLLLCQVVLSVAISVFYVNIYCNMCFLLWTSINRYVTVVQPRYTVLQAFRSPQRCSVLCAATWLVFLVIVTTRVTWTQVKIKWKPIETNGSCSDVMEYHKKEQRVTLAFGTLLFFLILGAMLVSYGLLLYHLQKIRRTCLQSAGFRPGLGLRVKRKVLASMSVFLVCFLPHHIQRSVRLLSAREEDSATEQMFSKVQTVTILVAALNCCLNPILHLVLRLPCCRPKRPKCAMAVTDCSRNQIPQIHITEATERELGTL
ncbi:probable G-protein coupled receptor 82 [Sardina pilchardus]|uniref:probable G-protein coupled receptor 82 n=1 Tax=Sardina pilchardus TaxID=27697 RepID=UPI002E0D2FA7